MRWIARDAASFWEHVTKTPDCWLWAGTRSTSGYGLVRWNGKRQRAHRIAYELTFGPFAKDLFVCHHCDNPRCVRPDHLFVGTATDNLQDAANKGRHPMQRDPRRSSRYGAHPTHCKRGHLLSEANVYLRKAIGPAAAPGAVWKQCKTCHNALMRRRRSAHV